MIPSFDLIANTGKAYQNLWEERFYLARLALLPILIKMVCYVLVFTQGYQDNVIRMTLVMLPSIFLEGWMLAHYTRLIFLGQRWPFKPTGNLEQDMMAMRARARGVLAGAIIYVLITMVISGVMAALIPLAPQSEAEASASSPLVALLFFMVLAGSIWGFRFVFLHVPYAVNLDLRYYNGLLPGIMNAFRLMGLWLLCSVPFFLILSIANGLIHGLTGGVDGEERMATFLMLIIISIIETVKNLVLTGGVAYCVLELYARDKGKA